jgi:hypothetical protein
MFGMTTGTRTCASCGLFKTTYGHAYGFLCGECYRGQPLPDTCKACKGRGYTNRKLSLVNKVCTVCDGGGAVAPLRFESVDQFLLEG